MSLRTETDLRPYQRRIARSIVRNHGKKPGALLAIEMSLGKTATTLTAIRRLLDQWVVRKVLIVAPLRVATMSWPDEIEAWEHTRVLKYQVLCGDAKKRQKALDEFLSDPSFEVAIINRENLTWLYQAVGGKSGWPFDMLVYDESSRLKEGKKRTGSGKMSEFGVIASTRPCMDYAILLTGTPSPNGIEDLWGQAYTIDMGQRLGTTKRAFLERWFTPDYMGYNWTARPGAEDEIMDRMRSIMVSLKTEDVISLPPVIESNAYVDLTPAQMKAYKRFERTLALEEYDVEAVNKGVLANKLIQYANGGLYRLDEDVYPPKREVIEIHNAKMAALDSIVAETNGENLLIAYCYEFDLDRLKKRFPNAVVADEDPEGLRAWNRGEVPQLLAHPASIGHGLNLQYGGRHTIWYGLTASLELYQQFNARLRRPGQKSDRVFLHRIITRGTFDERLVEILTDKSANQDRVKSAVRMQLAQA